MKSIKRKMSVKAMVEGLRPEQWIKNLFVFVGILFSQNVFKLPLLLRVIVTFVIFCLVSGSIYLFNDLIDLQNDRNHSIKRNRPLASGRLKASHAKFLIAVLIPLSITISFCLERSFFIAILIYILIQIAYSLYLKHIVILDIFCIASGFILRVVSGALVIDIEISNWLLLCTTLLALFLALCKRRHELTLLEEKASSHRKVLGEYSPYLLDQMISVVTASAFISYALYTMSEVTIAKFNTKNLVFTIPFVLYGILRYQYLVHKKNDGGNPEKILVTDKALLIDIILWGLAIGVILYG